MGEGLLGTAEIQDRLDADKIFVAATWTPANLRGAAYDLRAARDGLKDPKGIRYAQGDDRPQAILRLEVGDAAMLSSVERFCMPWDVAGLMGVKFNLARRGILMLTGLTVDPGYGLEFAGKGNWVAKKDQRVHFLVTNVGDDAVEIELGTQAVASIQFFGVPEPDEDRKQMLTIAMNRTTSENSQLASSGVGLFTALERLRAEVKALTDQADTRHRETTSEVAELRNDLDLTRGLTNTLVSLGIFVVLVTFLAGAIGLLFAVFENGTLPASITSLEAFLANLGPNGTLVALVVVAAFVIVCWLAARVLTTLFTRDAPRK
jgi:deoxycytidine triphosphate deaminase